MEIAFVQVDDDVRLQTNKINGVKTKTSGICIDAAVLDIIWSFVSYLRRQFRVTKEAASMQRTFHKTWFTHFIGFVCAFAFNKKKVKKTRQNKRKRYKQKGLVAVGFLRLRSLFHSPNLNYFCACTIRLSSVFSLSLQLSSSFEFVSDIGLFEFLNVNK